MKKWQNTLIKGQREVHQEYYIYGPLEFIGTVGGTLGLFVGFSFYDFIAVVIDFMFKKMNISQSEATVHSVVTDRIMHC